MAVYFKDGKWIADYYIDRHRYRERYPTKKLAELAIYKRKVQKAEGKFLDKKRVPKVLFKDFSEFYYKTYSIPNKLSAPTDRVVINNLNKFFGDKYLHQITPLMVEQYRALRKEHVKPRTINIEHQILSHMLSKAVEWGKASDNPASKVKKFREDSHRLRFLDNEEINRLLEKAPLNLKPLIEVALYTGMRRGELFNLTWKDIDWNRRVIHVVKSKSGKVREIPMSNIAHNILLKLKSTGNQEKVFDKTNFRKLFALAVRKAEINSFRFHDLRHTFASHLIMSGSDLVTAKELLGHSRIETTMIYSHLSPDHKKQAVEQLANKIGRSTK